MPLSTEVANALYGAWRLARLDRDAMRWFERSLPGVWRSFLAAAICYPAFLVLLWLRADAASVAQAGWVRILLVESIGYVIGWTAYPLLALPFCRWLASEEQTLGFIAAYNWSQVLQTGLLLVAMSFGGVAALPEDAASTLAAIVYLLLLAYEWFIARIALDRGALPATALVLLDVVLSSALSLVTQSLY
ncbi:MAG TPA: hypothetical protein VN832_05240 [Stellaceae bacterium]|nr:hypothetical protein [Stellaceae bacterium]